MKRPALGVVEWFHVGEEERVERVARDLRALGVEHLRLAVGWASWFEQGGPEWYDWLLPRLACDFELLPCVHWTPPSLGIVPTVQSPPRRPRDYADFVDLLIDRHGRRFEYVELWNEPNNLNDWNWTLDTDWVIFCEMVGAAAYWAKERGKKTVLGGMCPTDPNWLRLMGERGVLRYIDAVGVHAFPGSWTTVWQGWESEVRRVREVLDAAGLPCEIWVTETGFSTWRHDERGQLRALVAALGASVKRVYWYSAEDLSPSRAACDGFHVDVRHYHFGLRTSDGEPKLLARTWQEGGLELVERLAAVGRSIRRRRGRHVVVTGGAGFVGTNVADRLLSEGRRVLVLDNLSRRGVCENLLWLRREHGERVSIELADIRDSFALQRALRGAEQVIHLAAQVAVTTSLDAPLHDHGVNVGGTIALLEQLRRLPSPPPLLFTSTNKVYGSLPDLRLVRRGGRWEPLDPLVREFGIGEERPLDFCTPYGCSKGAADQYVLDYAKSFDLQTVVFRMSCIYGPHQHGNEDQGWVAHFLLQALAGRPVTIYGDGAQVRDILFVDDLVDAMLLAHERIDGVAGRAFNIGGGPANAISLLELVDLIEELDGRRLRIERGEERVGDQRYYVSDTGRFAGETGWQPQVAAPEGIELLYRWAAERACPAEPRVRTAAR